MKKSRNKSSKTTSAEQIRKIMNYYDHQTDEEGAAEIEKAPRLADSIWMEIPLEDVAKVKKLLSKRRSA